MATGEEDSGKGQPMVLQLPTPLPFPSFFALVPAGRGVTRDVLHTQVSVTSSSEVSCRT